MKSFILLLAAGLSLGTAPFAAADPVPPGPGEYILISGGVSLTIWEKWKAAPHDGWWMNFVRAARIRINEIQAANPTADLTWLVYRPAYQTRGAQDSRDYLSDIRSVQSTYHIRLIFFDRTSEMIEYLNDGQNRRAHPICDLEYFGHSNKACFLFDYSNNIDSASKVWLHEKELGQIHRGIFARNAFVKSWGCHTGESFSKKFASATGVRMIGAKGKTQYMDDVLPIVSSADGHWIR
ncbi:MAG: hypothetical protein QOE70_3218 [Chthoniobacter sp.]|jgi:hypothetical protein|nr:hypothetical protein [Chthoniobacter sp.]